MFSPMDDDSEELSYQHTSRLSILSEDNNRRRRSAYDIALENEHDVAESREDEEDLFHRHVSTNNNNKAAVEFSFRDKCLPLCQNTICLVFYVVLVITALVTLAWEMIDGSPEGKHWLFVLNASLNAVMVVEVAIGISSYRSAWFNSWYNKFDFCVTVLCCMWTMFALYKLHEDRRRQLYFKHQEPFEQRGLFIDGEWLQGLLLIALYLARFAVLLYRARLISLFLHEADVPDVSSNDIVNTLFIGNIKNDELERLNKQHRASLRAMSGENIVLPSSLSASGFARRQLQTIQAERTPSNLHYESTDSHSALGGTLPYGTFTD